jgi:hypothetical protein
MNHLLNWSAPLAMVLILIISCGTDNRQTPQIDTSAKSQQRSGLLKVNESNVDHRLYENDVSGYEKDWSDNYPIGKLPFPVEPYDTPGNALGNIIDTINGHQLAGNYVWVGDEEAFFNILVITEEQKALSYRSILSRNAPAYVGQGVIRHDIGNIDWISFKSDKTEGYAIVSGKFFDLSEGKTVIVYKYESSGINFLQIDDTMKGHSEEYRKEFLGRIMDLTDVQDVILN